MQKDKKIKLSFYIVLAIFVFLIGYKIYLYLFESDYYSLNIKNINKCEQKIEQNHFEFAVIGNIKNSIGIFEKKLIPKLNKNDVDLLISTGNAVLGGSEDKYRVLYRSLEKLNIPYIIGVGEKEIEEFGLYNYYKHFGPLCFSFHLQQSYFIFLDSTDITSQAWQKNWLLKELQLAQKYKHIFVIINKPPFKATYKGLEKTKYVADSSYREFLQETFVQYNVTAVFSSNIEVFDQRQIKGVDFFISGGGGGFILDSDKGYYHYLKVSVQPDGVQYSVERLDSGLGPIAKRIESFWLFIHSIFYVSYFNYLLIVSFFGLVGIKLYTKIFRQTEYYRDFSLDEDIELNRNVSIAMFTNNYFPFLGGVPIAIYRLAKGLKQKKHTVHIFAPGTDKEESREIPVIRCGKIFKYKKFNEIPVANVFAPRIKKDFDVLSFDIVHVHHPFWLGNKGLKLAKKRKIPIVYTYHTRLEKYAHYFPALGLLFQNVLAHYMIKRFANKCDAIIAPTYSTEEYLRNIGVNTYIEIIPTGIDMDIYKSISSSKIKGLRDTYVKNGDLLLISVSRLTVEKNIHFLVQGLRYIKENIKIGFKCFIVGEGPEKENLQQTIYKNNLQEEVYLTGAMDSEELARYYLAADIFVFASKSETQGMVLLEAMAGNCPVVAVRSSGTDDVIQNGFNGFKTSESINVWGDKVVYLMEHFEERKYMSENAYTFATQHSIEQMAHKVEKVYAKAISKKSMAS